jgi:hypothetical protein
LHWLQANPAAVLVSTWPVATEVCALLARRIDNECALDFLRWPPIPLVARGGYQVLLLGAIGSLTPELRHALEPAERRDAVEHPAGLGVLRDVRLDEHQAALRVDACRQVERRHRPAA